MGISQPTPIQSASVPTALLGKDICACAVTGSGKTLSFMLPTLERLLYKPKIPQRTRVLVLTPTRELAAQICKVTRDLAQFTSINVCLCAGGFDLRTQEAALRLSPDIVIATPGRLIDHLHNTPCFNLDTVEVFLFGYIYLFYLYSFTTSSFHYISLILNKTTVMHKHHSKKHKNIKFKVRLVRFNTFCRILICG